MPSKSITCLTKGPLTRFHSTETIGTYIIIIFYKTTERQCAVAGGVRQKGTQFTRFTRIPMSSPSNTIILYLVPIILIINITLKINGFFFCFNFESHNFNCQ